LLNFLVVYQQVYFFSNTKVKTCRGNHMGRDGI